MSQSVSQPDQSKHAGKPVCKTLEMKLAAEAADPNTTMSDLEDMDWRTPKLKHKAEMVVKPLK